MLEVGMKAPDFTLLDKRSNSVSPSDFLRAMPKVKPDTNATEILAYLNDEG